MDNVALFRAAIRKGFKILWDDIETSPVLAYTYPTWNVNIPHDNIIIDKQITSIAYMFEGEHQPKTLEWEYKSPIKIYPDRIEGGGDDRKILEKYVEVVESADLVIAQNGDSFDRKEIMWRMNDLQIRPLKSPVITLDTLKLSRKVFRPTSQKLDFRSQKYGLGGKIPQTMKDCIDVARGNIRAQEVRVRYNGKDVKDLRAIFWRELPYYTLPKSLVKMLREYIKDGRPFCRRCASLKQRKFDVKQLNSKCLECSNCGFQWKPKNS